jgi:CRP-like cAMP-binding protein
MPEVPDSMLRIFQRRIYQKDAVIFREGDRANYAYIILKGSVFIAKTTGKSHALLTTLVTNQMFGELALFESRPRSATAIAAEMTEVLLITKEQFDAKLGKLDGFMRYLVGYLADRIFDLSERVDD